MLTRDDTLERLRHTLDHPATAGELIQMLGIPREDRVGFRRHLKALAATGALVQLRGHRYELPGRAGIVVGRLAMAAGGFGFVVLEGAGTEENSIFVPRDGIGVAMHGDRVVATIDRRPAAGRPVGRVTRVLARAHACLVGRFLRDERGMGLVTPLDERVSADVRIAPGAEGAAQPGDLVAVEMTSWPTATRGPAGRVVEVFGDLETPGTDVRVIIRKHGLPDEHSPAARAEACRLTHNAAAPETVDAEAAALAGRTDFRDWTVVTIDGEQARDFDDAISLERLANGHFRLGVHIADVAQYVEPGSALDQEAYDRGTSVYFPERAIHMFPEALATGLCSLAPGVDRLVQSVVMEIDERGRVVRESFHDGVIRCCARMTYTDVNRIVSDRDPETRRRHEPLVPLFERMAELYAILSERRHEEGSIDIDLDEPEIILDEQGLVEAITASERNIAHRIIEEFMLLANQRVASFLIASGGPGLFRVHEAPDPVKVDRFQQLLIALGCSLAAPPDAVHPGHFAAVLRRFKGRPEERPVALLLLRTLQQAHYAAANLGHFGLAFDCYTHFTSPIRRYPDLVVHRLLRAARAGTLASPAIAELAEALPDIARHTSEREQRAEQAERELVEWKKIRFMQDKVGDEFEGFVTGVTSFGLFVELIEHFVEGLVHVSAMADDHYRFDPRTYTLRGEDTHRVYRLGDRLRVQVIRVDRFRRQIELGLPETLRGIHRGQRPRRSRRQAAASRGRMEETRGEVHGRGRRGRQ